MDIADVDLFPGTILCKQLLHRRGSRYLRLFMEDLAWLPYRQLYTAYLLYFIPEQESGGCREVHGLYQKQKCGETAVDDSGYPYGWTVVQRAFRRKYFFTVLGMLIGLLLCHGLIQIIYEFDIRSVLMKKWHLFVAGGAAAFIFCFFY